MEDQQILKDRTCKCGNTFIVDISYPPAYNSPNSPICPKCEDRITDYQAEMNKPAERD